MTVHPLLSLARQSLQDYFHGKNNPPEQGEITGEGIFVTLHKAGRLRGCIGCLEAIAGETREKLIYRYARTAALEDPRFPPLKEKEQAEIDIEITLLSPFIKVMSMDEIEIGRDGLYLSKGYRSGLFLPQVPQEQQWDMDAYLENLCYKAGLPKDSWKDSQAELFRFTGEIIKE